MTSIKIIRQLCDRCLPCACSLSVEQENQIIRDLEVLEILKNESDYKKIIEKDGIATFHLDMVLTQDTILKVKEWLENE